MLTREAAIEQIRAAAKKYLGRDMSDREIIEQGLSGGKHYQQVNVDSAIASMINSPEAKAYASSDPADPTGNTGTEAGQTYTGFDPAHTYEGFDFAREQNTGKSAKDAFAFLANQAPPPPEDKAGLETWFDTYIRPGMDKLGHQIKDVTGDKFSFNNWQGDWTIDFYRGAGAPGGAFAWQPEGTGANARPYTPITAGDIAPPPTPPPAPETDLGGNGRFDPTNDAPTAPTNTTTAGALTQPMAPPVTAGVPPPGPGELYASELARARLQRTGRRA